MVGTTIKPGVNATPEAIFSIVDAGHPPLRLIPGSHNLAWIQSEYTERCATWVSVPDKAGELTELFQ